MGIWGVGCGRAQGGRMGEGQRVMELEGGGERLEEGVAVGGEVRGPKPGGGEGLRGAGIRSWPGFVGGWACRRGACRGSECGKA